MDFPSFNHHNHNHHHHHHRYAPPPPPPHTNFSDDRPNFYHPHHHIPSVNHLPPPPLPYPHPPPPPPPPPVSVHVPPPSQLYNPDFTFLDAQNPSFFTHNRSSPPRVSGSNHSYRFDYRNDFRSDPARVPPELSHRNPVLPEEHQDYHRSMYSSNPQSESYYKSASRFIDDNINDGYANNIVSSNFDSYPSVRSVVNGNKSSTGKDYVDKYEPRYVSMSENDRIWKHHGEEDPKWVMKGKSEVGRDDGGSFAYGRERDRDYEHESGKFNRVREGRDREEFKQVQKKSVLLRIGKPNNTNRNRNYEQHASKGYFVESNSSNHRGKDKGKDRDRDHTGKDCRVEGDRARSPVDLDVSFKSNALVAKPVVTPSSPLSDNNNTQTKNRKIKRVNEFGSPLSKFSELSTRSGSSSHGFDSPSSSEKASKQQTHKDSVSNEDNSSLPAPVLDQGDGNGGSKAQPLSFRLKKKRKLMNPASRSFNFQLAVKDNKDIKGENLENTPTAPISSAIPFPTLEETVDSKVDKSSQASVLEKDSSEVRKPNLHCINSLGDDCTENKNLTAQNVSMIDDGLGNELNQQPCGNDVLVNLENDTQNISPDVRLSLGGANISPASGHNQVEIQKASTESNGGFDVVNVSNSLCNEPVKTQEMNPSLHCINSFDDDCTENKSLTGQNVSMINHGLANELNQQQCGNEVPVNLENDTQNISTDVRLSLSGIDIVNVVDASNSLCNEPVKIQETSTVSDMNNPLDSCSDDIDIISVSPEKSDDQGFLDDVSRKEDESQLFEGSTSNQRSFNRSTEYSEDALKDSIHTDIFSGDNATRSSSHKEHSFDKDAITEMVTPISTSVQRPSPDHREQLSTDLKDDLPPSSSIVSAFVTDSNGKSGDYRPDTLTGIFSPEKVSSFSDSQSLVSKSTYKSISNLGIPENDDNIIVKSVSKDVALLNAPKTSIKTSSVKTLGSNTNLQGSNLPLKKPSSVPVVPRVFAARSSPSLTNSRISKTANNANNATKPRTWHRSSSTPAPVPLPPKQTAMGQNSYIRSGNSLVRKAAPVTAVASRSSVYQLNPSAPNEARNSAVSGNKLNNTCSRVAGSGASVVRPKTPPLSGGTKLPDCPTYLRDMSSSPLELLPASPVEGNLVVQKVSEDQIHASSNFESQKVEDEVATGKKIQYVKRKSNQLVAASCSDQSVQELDKTQASSSSDSYYKRRKNQLIRTAAGNDSANTDVGKASKNSFKRQSGKVWTLTSQSLGKDGVSLRQKLRPQLFPWKRSRNWVNLMNLSASVSSNSSLSSISRKLLLSRKRDTIYTRSKHGFSLRMSKLLSVGGSSLKWSKSIERNSQRTNEEATLAVATAEKKKREHGTVSATAEIKSRNNMSRVRIFRIGSVRYKMDPSKRTLQRISDGEPSNSMQPNEEIRKSYVPKRLKIGHDEYVRIGNGNQLVRNPKRRTRVFANEKVRWSLHTARTRLAKKKKFCQFFTRFGKCNKDDGKCPYIHDSSKIAVCTKFLNGSCSNPNCKLTHKVIPERMQDCSYFLQGLCSNNRCPYRHVNVNSAASVCEGFLKGYCADGNECRKKHSYACPAFEATGTCSQGTKCKLHHPKNQLKRKQQSSMDQQQKNSRGRYFGSVRVEEATGVSEKLYLKNDDMDDDVDLCQEGKFAEYISLDVGNEEAGKVTGESRTSLMMSEPLGLDADVFDELTKPIGIMNRVVLDSPSECDMGVS